MIVGFSGMMMAQALKAQTKCPVSGGPINKAFYADIQGKRIYCCSAECVEKVKMDPRSAINKIEASGETLEEAPMEAPIAPMGE